MQEYAESQICRRRILLNYFGETMDHDCGNCDVCKNPPQRFDGTILVQKALSAILRTQQQIGFRLLIDILRGTANYEICQRGYQQIKTFGCGKDVAFKDWQDYLLQMLHMGYIELDYKDNSHLKVTSLGEDVLYGRKSAMLAVIVREDFTVKGRKNKQRQQSVEDNLQSNMVEDAVLFEKLRVLRTQLANEAGVPPYVIFGDSTLHMLASIQPETRIAFGNISGVGIHKQETLGTIFIKTIRQYKGLSIDEAESWNSLEPLLERETGESTTPKKTPKIPKDFITLNGTKYHIGVELMKCITWRKTIDLLSKDVYYNLWKESRYPMSRYVDEGVNARDAVVKRFAEIIVEVYKVTVSPDLKWIDIPVRIEYDESGSPVHSLQCNSFEEALGKLKNFVEQNGHWPFSASGEYECSLRRWQHEISHDIIPITHSQHQAYEELMTAFADKPKTRYQFEKKN